MSLHFAMVASDLQSCVACYSYDLVPRNAQYWESDTLGGPIVSGHVPADTSHTSDVFINFGASVASFPEVRAWFQGTFDGRTTMTGSLEERGETPLFKPFFSPTACVYPAVAVKQ
jgi:hypothetical protein